MKEECLRAEEREVLRFSQTDSRLIAAGAEERVAVIIRATQDDRPVTTSPETLSMKKSVADQETLGKEEDAGSGR
jgi:hypothetical protein